MIGREHAAGLTADATRLTTRLFLPGEGLTSAHSRTVEIAARVLAISAKRTETLAAELVAAFSARHLDVVSVFERNARVVESRITNADTLTPAQRTVLGASFTTEYAVEGAALCNPSAVAHPDQSGLLPGQLRVAVSTRSIGEGHRSSITFAEAVIGADRSWTFAERQHPLAQASINEGTWDRDQLRRALEQDGRLTELSSAALSRLPQRFPAVAVAAAVSALPAELTAHQDSRLDAEVLHRVAMSTYEANFGPATSLSQRVLLPVAADEDHGMEDARFVRFTDANGVRSYRASYTAYDGRDVSTRLITSPDLAHFVIQRLSGDATHTKGIALFPRIVGDAHLALSRTDGESISLARSPDGMNWTDVAVVHRPTEPWELVQTGNCGSPIETPRGWIVLTHGVGPMRSYSMGALLLDLDDPRRVVARTTEPILNPARDRDAGYVPNVVYSCGGLVHDGTLWIPFGIDDSRVGVFSLGIDELLNAMTVA
ncbi:glycosylase [Gryllotalpicola koreensis]|uniref:Glycoside hydrolase family 130 protein n=1 Tax=Gryllotalpicola koreensis TaxID=993086 RepID=A0ABP8ADH6_9MICO